MAFSFASVLLAAPFPPQKQNTSPRPAADIVAENLDRVAVTADQILEVLNKDSGLMVEFKRLLAEDAGNSGQILEEQDLNEGAVNERLRQDLRTRVLATQLLRRYGYLQPKINPDMKAFLLAAGFGTRLKSLTDNTPKCLLPVQDTPMLQIWFAICRQCGVDEILINVHSHGQAVREFVEENKGSLKVRLFEEAVLLGSAGTVRANRDWIEKEDSFWVLYADVLTATNLNQLRAFHESLGQIATIGVSEVANPSRCGVVQVDDRGMVRDFVEKPLRPVSNLAFSGLMLATPALLDVIPDESPVDLGFHVLPQLVGRMAPYPVSDFLIDIGTLETYRAAQESWPGLSLSNSLT